MRSNAWPIVGRSGNCAGRERLIAARKLLARGHSVTDACLDVGFSSLGSFSALFARKLGISPAAYQRSLRRSVCIPDFESTAIHDEVKRLKEKGVVFTMGPMDAGTVTIAIFSDTCGNLLQMHQQKS